MSDKAEDTTPKVDVEETEAEESSKDLESEEPQAYFEPVVKLDEVEVVSGEEDEEVLFKIRAKLFCFRETLLDKGTGKKSWCERGVGDVRFLKHKEHQKVRMLMRQEKTHKIIINHLVDSRTELSPNMGSDRAWVFSCYDYAEGTLETQVFALRFTNAENAQKFKEAHDTAKSTNKALEAGADAADTTAGDDAANALESLGVKKEALLYVCLWGLKRQQPCGRAFFRLQAVIHGRRGRERAVVDEDARDDEREAHEVEPAELFVEEVLGGHDREEVGREQRQVEHGGVAILEEDLK